MYNLKVFTSPSVVVIFICFFSFSFFEPFSWRPTPTTYLLLFREVAMWIWFWFWIVFGGGVGGWEDL